MPRRQHELLGTPRRDVLASRRGGALRLKGEEAIPRPGLFVAYYRVSTGRQTASGLGLEAQRASVEDHVKVNGGRLIANFSETASGRKDNRAELDRAISFCRIARATLVIARLDRLSRSLDMIARLMESGLDFVAADFPHANKFTIHVLAAIAEYELRLHSVRTKEALAAAKVARRVKHRPNHAARFPPGCREASASVRREKAEARAKDLAPLVWRLVAEGKSYAHIAQEFNETGVVPHRRSPWTKNAVSRIAQRTRKELSNASASQERQCFGAAQIKVQRLVANLQPWVAVWRQNKTPYTSIADELERMGVPAPWGGRWSGSSIRRYVMRALGVDALRPPKPA